MLLMDINVHTIQGLRKQEIDRLLNSHSQVYDYITHFCRYQSAVKLTALTTEADVILILKLTALTTEADVILIFRI